MKKSLPKSTETTEASPQPPQLSRRRIIAIGVIGTFFLLGATGLAIALWQGLLHNDPKGTVVRIVTSSIETSRTLDKRLYTNEYQSGLAAVGSSGEKYGTIKNVWGFDEENKLLGQARNDVKVYDGESAKFTIDQGSRSHDSARFIDVLAGEEEMCVSWIEADAPNDQTEKHMWFGHVGYECGQLWAYGEKPYPTDWDASQPSRCMWMGANVNLDANGGYDGVRQMKINMRAYTHDWYIQGPDWLCNNTIFSNATTGPIEANPAELSDTLPFPESIRTNTTTTRRSLRPRAEALASRLIITSRAEHSARELCLSPTSHSSDLVSTHEELFCDMWERLLHPLCGSSTDEGVGRCFDLRRRAMVERRGNVRRAPRRSRYLNVVEWT